MPPLEALPTPGEEVLRRGVHSLISFVCYVCHVGRKVNEEQSGSDWTRKVKKRETHTHYLRPQGLGGPP